MAKVEKVERYEAPDLSAEFADLAPDTDVKLNNVQALYDEARANAYVFYQKARAQQAAAEDFLRRGIMVNYHNLIKGVQPNPQTGQGGLQGVDSMDDMARLWLSRARIYKTELDALKAEKAARSDPPADEEEPADKGEPDGEG